MTKEEVREVIEQVIEDKLSQKCTAFSTEEIESLKGFLNTKKSAAKVFIFMIGLIGAWIAKDIYMWIISHLKWIGGSG